MQLHFTENNSASNIKFGRYIIFTATSQWHFQSLMTFNAFTSYRIITFNAITKFNATKTSPLQPGNSIIEKFNSSPEYDWISSLQTGRSIELSSRRNRFTKKLVGSGKNGRANLFNLTVKLKQRRYPRRTVPGGEAGLQGKLNRRRDAKPN